MLGWDRFVTTLPLILHSETPLASFEFFDSILISLRITTLGFPPPPPDNSISTKLRSEPCFTKEPTSVERPNNCYNKE